MCHVTNQTKTVFLRKGDGKLVSIGSNNVDNNNNSSFSRLLMNTSNI